MIAISPEFSTLLRAYRFEKKLRLRDMVEAMKPHVDQWNKKPGAVQLLMFSTRALSNHFNNHESSDVQMKYQLDNKLGARKLPANKSLIPPGAPLTGVQAQIQIHVKSVAVFDELTTLFEKLKVLFEGYLTKHPEINALTIHLDIIREMRKTLAELAKLKQSKELVKIAVRSVIDTFLTKLVEDAGKSVDALKAKLLTRYKEPQDLVYIENVVETFRKQTVETVMESARTAIDRVRVEFALSDKDET